MEKKQEILMAANECFMQYGYVKTSMSDIGRKINLNKASLYYHFKDKLSLYRAVVLMHRHKHIAEVERQISRINNSIEKIQRFILEEIKFSQRASVILTTGNNNVADAKVETKAVYYEIIEDDALRIEKMLQQGIENKELIACDTTQVSRMIMTIIDAILNVNCPLFVDETDRDQVYIQVQEQLAMIVQLMLNGLKTKD